MQPELIRAIARALYIRRHYTHLSFGALSWTYTEHNNVVEQMYNWKCLSEEERQVWLNDAEQWLEQTRSKSPNVYALLAEGVINVELEGDYQQIAG